METKFAAYTLSRRRLLSEASLAATLLALAGISAADNAVTPPARDRLKVRLTWGHRTSQLTSFSIRLRTKETALVYAEGLDLAPQNLAGKEPIRSEAGGGKVRGVVCVLEYAHLEPKSLENLNKMWADLITQSDPDTARRLRADPALRIDPRKLTVETGAISGFSLTVDQLLTQRAFYIPMYDVFLTAGDEPIAFDVYAAELEKWKGLRVLDQVHAAEEATLAQYQSLWEDMGSLSYRHPDQPAPSGVAGHVVCLAWDGSLNKFGVDRGAGVVNDLGNPDQFQLWLDVGRIDQGLARNWRSQKLTDGLPVIKTVLEREGLRCEIEQFAYPLHGPPKDRLGDVAMVLLQSVRLTNMTEQPRSESVQFTHLRNTAAAAALVLRSPSDGVFLCRESDGTSASLLIEGEGLRVGPAVPSVQAKGMKGIDVMVTAINLSPGASTQFIVKLPSPMVAAADLDVFSKLNYSDARAATLKFWSDHLAAGALFEVPEPAVNELFRANLWHAMRLPRRHGVNTPEVTIDMPYTNFAYGQEGIPWPMLQALYVDSMLYDLRGHHAMSADELLAIYRINQEPSGHVKGFANWLVYTPAMVCAAARHFLLSGDRASFDKLLPPTLKAADWCLDQIRKARPDSNPGLVHGPLNDLTGNGTWAFNQAFLFAALDTLDAALARLNHTRAKEFREALTFSINVCIAFSLATMESPLVQLRDHTWSPYVPSDILTPGRRMDQWYPTDADSGAMHLPRFGAVPPDGHLATALLDDHEDNLFLKNLGMANEPVYNPQATVYLLRDDPKAFIRAFYSQMACAFSHGQLEPVEHRWTHGQFFGPPSTDGAWFETLRNMLIHERPGEQLVLLAATPRVWLEEGKTIRVKNAPTFYGPLSMSVASSAASGLIRADITLGGPHCPKELLVRFRHPNEKRMKSVTLNGKDWPAFDVDKEWVRIVNPIAEPYAIVVSY